MEYIFCVGKGVSNETSVWGVIVGGVVIFKVDFRVLGEGVVVGSRVFTLIDMVVLVEVVWCVL